MISTFEILMRRFNLVALLFTFLLVPLATHAGELPQANSNDWPWWRGPYRNGHATTDQAPPLEWGEEKNVLWQTPIPGRGHGSPTVVGDRIFLAIAEEDVQKQSVLCLDRRTGKELWKTKIHEGGFRTTDREPNERASWASGTVACDGERLFINFLNNEIVTTTALDLDGKIVWQQKVTDYQTHQGYGSSPTLYGPLVIVTADSKKGGVVAAFNRETGKPVWSDKRPELPNYPSPIVLHADGKDQVIVVGCDLVASYEPLTGKKLWQCEGATTECVTSTVTDGTFVITSGGYPDNHISAVRADGSGVTEWRNTTRVYVPSMLVHNEHLFAVTDAGIATCYEMATGKVAWKHRLGTTFSASPVLVGESIFVTGEDGLTVIFKANTKKYVAVGKNQLANHVAATPAFCGNQIYMRAAILEDDRRQEIVYCLGTEK